MSKIEISPFLKWAGGKRQLLPEIKKYIPDNINTYYEPFIGAGAVFLDLQPSKAVINDINYELINCYKVIRDKPEELILELSKFKNTEEDFYRIRNWDKEENYKKRSDAEKAARTIYLNKTCFNGLYRVNSKGFFNVPYGKYKNPAFVNKENIDNLSKYLKSADITLLNKDFEEVLKDADKGDFVYFDPPYFPLNKTSSFTSYSKDGFTEKDQIRLKEKIDELTDNGVLCLVSNSCCDFIKDLYKKYEIIEISAKRNINSEGSKRQPVKEVLIKNF